MTEAILNKTTRVQRLVYGRERAVLSSQGGQRDLPFEDLEKRSQVEQTPSGEAVGCMFTDEFLVLEMRREAR
jgi:hypothetical protein